jgi:hypothetical protein
METMEDMKDSDAPLERQNVPVRAPFFQGEWLPTPPQQNAPWQHGDDALSQAAATLFEQGLARSDGQKSCRRHHFQSARGLEQSYGSPNRTKWFDHRFSRLQRLPDVPPPGQKVSFRVCDAYAYFYSQYQNGPKFHLFWPVKKRDEGVLACRKWLEAK